MYSGSTPGPADGKSRRSGNKVRSVNARALAALGLQIMATPKTAPAFDGTGWVIKMNRCNQHWIMKMINFHCPCMCVRVLWPTQQRSRCTGRRFRAKRRLVWPSSGCVPGFGAASTPVHGMLTGGTLSPQPQADANRCKRSQERYWWLGWFLNFSTHSSRASRCTQIGTTSPSAGVCVRVGVWLSRVWNIYNEKKPIYRKAIPAARLIIYFTSLPDIALSVPRLRCLKPPVSVWLNGAELWIQVRQLAETSCWYILLKVSQSVRGLSETSWKTGCTF